MSLTPVTRNLCVGYSLPSRLRHEIQSRSNTRRKESAMALSSSTVARPTTPSRGLSGPDPVYKHIPAVPSYNDGNTFGGGWTPVSYTAHDQELDGLTTRCWPNGYLSGPPTLHGYLVTGSADSTTSCDVGSGPASMSCGDVFVDPGFS